MSAFPQFLGPSESRHGYDEGRDVYVVVHPLDDRPEQKIDTEALGPMPMTTAVKWSLFSLRAYLVLMFVLVLYRVSEVAGLVRAGH